MLQPKDLTQLAFQRHLQGLGEHLFDIGIGLEAGDLGSFFRKLVPLEKADHFLPLLKSKNASHHHIYIRPGKPSGLVLLDDLKADGYRTLANVGLEPACWVETSPQNFQAWIRLSSAPIEPKRSTFAAKILAKRFCADPNSADWRHYGRLAGFTNRKAKYERNGRFPFVVIHEWRGALAPFGAQFLASLDEKEKGDSEKRSSPMPPFKKSANGETYNRFARRILAANSDKPWASDPDWSRMDWMIGKDMMHAGFSQQAIGEAILQGSPNLSQRHAGEARLANYVKHTVEKLFSGNY